MTRFSVICPNPQFESADPIELEMTKVANDFGISATRLVPERTSEQVQKLLNITLKSRSSLQIQDYPCSWIGEIFIPHNKYIKFL